MHQPQPQPAGLYADHQYSANQYHKQASIGADGGGIQQQPAGYEPSAPPLGPADHAAPAFEDEKPVKRECNDLFFLLPFLALVVMMIVFAAKYGREFIDATTVEDATSSSAVQILARNMALAGLAAAAMSLVWIAIMVLAGAFLIWAALLGIIALNLAAAYLLTKRAYDDGVEFYYWPAIVFGLIALLIILYVVCIRRRIKFAAVHLKVAGHAIFRLPMTLVVAVVMVCVQLGWAVVWALGSMGFLFHQDYIQLKTGECTVDNCDLEINAGAVIGVLAGLALIYFWATFVLRNVIAVTTAGTVAAWKSARNTPFITMGAWARALTLNLGSICFGSLIVAILETIIWLLNCLSYALNRTGNCVAACLVSCLACIIRCIESAVEFFNRFAYSYVGCYGYSFVTASRHVFQLFAKKGWSAIVNDNLTGNVFWLGNIVIGAVTAYIAIQILSDSDATALAILQHPDAFVGFFGFVVGYAVNNLFMAVVASAVTTVFVLWAEDPRGWQLTRPDHYEDLHRAWLKIYPDEYNNGYGKQQATDADGRV